MGGCQAPVTTSATCGWIDEDACEAQLYNTLQNTSELLVRKQSGNDATFAKFSLGASGRQFPPTLLRCISQAQALSDGEDGHLVLPCELDSCPEFHDHMHGESLGFCSVSHRLVWEGIGIANLQSVGGDLLNRWQCVDPDFALQWHALANVELPFFNEMQARVESSMQQQAAQYTDFAFLAGLPNSEVQALRLLAQEPAIWPQAVASSAQPRIRSLSGGGSDVFDEALASALKSCTLQLESVTSMEQTYAAGLGVAESLYLFSRAVAAGVGGSKDVLFSVKKPLSLLSKILERYPEDHSRGEFRRCCDVYRTSIILDTAAQVQRAFELLKGFCRDSPDRANCLRHIGMGDETSDIVLERIKNRFAAPCRGGYMDLLANVRIDGYVCEVQLHLSRLLHARGEAGQRNWKWARRYVGKADVYVGERSPDGKRHGQGSMRYAVGHCYEGEWLDDREHGVGATSFASGNRYEGQYAAGVKQGRGSYHYASGDSYEGEYDGGKKHGEGSYHSAGGDRYEGSYLDGAMHGQGIYYTKEGDKYAGSWVEDQLHGKGTVAFASGDVYTGDFVKGLMHGKGTYYFADGERYKGGYLEGQMHGRGALYFSDGSCYDGEFREGERHGRGVQTDQAGCRAETFWRYGARVRQLPDEEGNDDHASTEVSTEEQGLQPLSGAGTRIQLLQSPRTASRPALEERTDRNWL